MVATLWQGTSLVSYGRAWLAGDPDAVPSMDGPGFRFSRTFTVTVGRPWRQIVASPGAWFAWLRRHDCRTIGWWLDPEVTAKQLPYLAFAGSARWALVTELRRATLVWYFQEALGDRDDPEQRIWRHGLRGSRAGRLGSDSPGLAGSRERLAAALSGAAAFSAEQQWDSWRDHFAVALSALNGAGALPDYAAGALPDHGYSLAAKQTLAAAGAAWCFGGMGSWNDVGLPDGATQQRYEAVSQDLYRAILTAVQASTESFEPGDS
jgi:hypothetical protein